MRILLLLYCGMDKPAQLAFSARYNIVVLRAYLLTYLGMRLAISVNRVWRLSVQVAPLGTCELYSV